MNHRILAPALAFALVLAVIPLAAAQAPIAPLEEKAAEKLSAAQSDPAGYAQQQATEEQLADDARWASDYACDVRDAAEQATGVPVPAVEDCEELQRAVGIEEQEQDAEEEVVADARELEEDAVAGAEELVDDVDQGLAEALDDPEEAPNVILRIVGGAVLFIEGVVDGLVGAVATLLDEVLATIAAVPSHAAALPQGVADGVSLPVSTGFGILADAGQGVATSSLDGIEAAREGTASAISGGASAVADAVTSTANAIGDAAGSLASGIGDLWTGLFGPDDGGPADAAPDTPDLDDGVTEPVDDLLGRVGRIVDGAA